MDKPQSTYNMLARKVLIAAETGDAEKIGRLFVGRQPEEVVEALSDVTQERFNDVFGHVRFTPLIAAAYHGHPEVVETLVKKFNVKIDEVGYMNLEGKQREVNALCAAVLQGESNLEVAQHILDLGSDVNFCCPLWIACQRGDIPTMKFLLKNNANVNGDYKGVTPLMVACERISLYTVRLLLNNGADPRLEDQDGNTALHRIALKTRMFVLKNGPLPQVVDKLVSAGAQQTENHAGQTPLDAACFSGNVEATRAIMVLPEIRPEAQLTAQEKLNEKLENDKLKGRASVTSNGSIKSVFEDLNANDLFWGKPFENPNEVRKLRSSGRKSRKNAHDKIEEAAETTETAETPEAVEITETAGTTEAAVEQEQSP